MKEFTIKDIKRARKILTRWSVPALIKDGEKYYQILILPPRLRYRNKKAVKLFREDVVKKKGGE